MNQWVIASALLSIDTLFFKEHVYAGLALKDDSQFRFNWLGGSIRDPAISIIRINDRFAWVRRSIGINGTTPINAGGLVFTTVWDCGDPYREYMGFIDTTAPGPVVFHTFFNAGVDGITHVSLSSPKVVTFNFISTQQHHQVKFNLSTRKIMSIR